MRLQKGPNAVCIFLRQERAGAVHQRTAGAHVAADRIDKPPLRVHDGGDVLLLQAQLDIRLLAQNAQPRAGRIQQNAVQRALQVGPEVQRITHGDAQVVQPQPPAYAFQ